MGIQIGDRVRVRVGVSHAGLEGTVVFGPCKKTELVAVQFDHKISGGHDCEGHGKRGYCWWFPKSSLEVVKKGKKKLDEKLVSVLKALNGGAKLVIKYKAKDDEEKYRLIKPHNIQEGLDGVNVLAFCYSSNGVRTFKFSGITEVLETLES